MLQVDPTLTKLAQARKRSLATALLTLALLSALLLFSGKKFFRPVFPFISADLWWFPALIVLFFLAIQLAAAQEGFLRRTESRRQAAFLGEKRFLAAEQPEANANAMKLPATFRVHLNNQLLIGAFAVPMAVTFVIRYLSIWLARTPDSTSISFWLFSGIFVLALLLILLTGYWLFSTEVTQIIEVTDEGLRTRYKGQENSIRWADARLFACYGAFGDAHGRGVQTYELSGSEIVVKWAQYQRKNRMWFLEMDGEFEDYRRRMSALNEVIAARTDLQLCDLR